MERRHRSCIRPGCSELSLPQDPFRRHRSFIRCQIAAQDSSLRRALSPPCSFTGFPCPLVGELGISRDSLPLGRLPLSGTGSTSYCTNKANKAVSAEKGSSLRFSECIWEPGEAETHITTSAEGRWSRAPGSHLFNISFQRDLHEPLLKAVTVLRDTRLLGTLPHTTTELHCCHPSMLSTHICNFEICALSLLFTCQENPKPSWNYCMSNLGLYRHLVVSALTSPAL